MTEPLPPILGEDPVFLDVVEQTSRLAATSRSCLVVGERGTGKELFAARLHYLSPLWAGPLVKVNCAALSESLLDSELFGHEAGAFTGAQSRRLGRFERADGDTLILDEIAAASPAVQEKILRVIEYGEFERLGGAETLRVDVRVVGSANVDLPSLAEGGVFRADLLDRLAFDVLTLPPLRARPTDILTLAAHFAFDAARRLGRDGFAGFGPSATAVLVAHPWPGNVRELKNVVERSVHRALYDDQSKPDPGSAALGVDQVIIDPFASPWRPPSRLSQGGAAPVASDPVIEVEADADMDFDGRVAAFEARMITSALVAARHNQAEAARALAVGYHRFRRLLVKHNISGYDQPG